MKQSVVEQRRRKWENEKPEETNSSGFFVVYPWVQSPAFVQASLQVDAWLIGRLVCLNRWICWLRRTVANKSEEFSLLCRKPSCATKNPWRRLRYLGMSTLESWFVFSWCGTPDSWFILKIQAYHNSPKKKKEYWFLSTLFCWSEWRDSNSRPLEPHWPGVPPGRCKHAIFGCFAGYTDTWMWKLWFWGAICLPFGVKLFTPNWLCLLYYFLWCESTSYHFT